MASLGRGPACPVRVYSRQKLSFFLPPPPPCVYVQVFLTMHTQQRPEVKVSECISQHGHGSWRAIMDRRDQTRLQDLGEQVFFVLNHLLVLPDYCEAGSLTDPGAN